MTEIFALDEVLERVDQDRDLLAELLQILFEESSKNLEELGTSVQAGDFSTIEKQAHSLKGALGNVGAAMSYQIAQELEVASKKNNGAECAALYLRLKNAVSAFKTEALKHFPGIHPQ